MKNGFRIVDSDMHIIEPGELWEKYIDGRFRDRAPKILGNYLVGYYGLMEGQMLPTVDSHARERFKGMNSFVGRHVQAHSARGFDAVAQLDAMDTEGLDMAVLFPTIGLYVMSFDGLEAPFAAAICRAYNNWLYEFCQADPDRLKGAAMVPPHDPGEAAKEARRAVRELGFKCAFLHPTMKPSQYFRRQCWVGAEEETGLPHVVAQIGADNIVWSTDYPHWDSDYPHAVDEFLGLGMADESKRRILWDNCARLYKL